MSRETGGEGSIRIVAPSIEDLVHLPGIERRAASVFDDADLSVALRTGTVPMDALETARVSDLLRVATGDDGSVGFALLEAYADAMHLAEVSVLPELARRGVGRRLVLAVLDIARGRGASSVTLTTFDHVAWNRPFYERCGFRTLPEARLSTRLRDTLVHERAVGLTRRVAMAHDGVREDERTAPPG